MSKIEKTKVIQNWIKDNFDISDKTHVSGMVLGHILWKFVNANCQARHRNEAYKKSYAYVKGGLPKTTNGSGHATRHFYDIRKLHLVLCAWYEEYLAANNL